MFMLLMNAYNNMQSKPKGLNRLKEDYSIFGFEVLLPSNRSRRAAMFERGLFHFWI